MESKKSQSDKYKHKNFEKNKTTSSNEECLKDEQNIPNTEQKRIYENIRIVQPIREERNDYETLEMMTRNETEASHNICANGVCTKERSVIIVLFTVCVSVGVAALVIVLAVENKPEAGDGSWSDWALWEACSTTCDVGMQIRRRNCSNPASVGYGRQCLGVDYEQKICMPRPCLKAVHGSWSAWALWESCSTTCDVGMQIRHRSCSNPAPVGYGRQCLGVDYEQKLCTPGPCLKAVDGSWSSWTLWETCSTTCDVGMQIRRRSCSSPAPIGYGRQCLGVDNEQRLCIPGPCLDTYTAFNAYYAKRANFSDGGYNVIFSTVLLNSGGAYNESSGVFTATFSGLYLFIGHFYVTVSQDADYFLKVEGRSVASGEF